MEIRGVPGLGLRYVPYNYATKSERLHTTLRDDVTV